MGGKRDRHDRAFGGADSIDKLDDVELSRMQRFHNVLEANSRPLPSAPLKSIGEYAARRYDSIPLSYNREQLVMGMSTSSDEAPRDLFEEARDREVIEIATVRWRPPAVVLIDTTTTADER